MKVVDINCDLGETSKEQVGRYAGLAKYITSANVACGFHAGSPETMRETVALCKRNRVDVGAHPSFPDRENFGRKAMRLSATDLRSVLLYQVGALEGVAKMDSVKVRHMKAHGALYNMAVERKDYGTVIAEVALMMGKILIAPEKSRMCEEAEANGVKVAYEGFADRGYNSNGTLARRGMLGALITDPNQAAERALRMVDGDPIETVDGGKLRLKVKTICVHGDTPGAERIARALRSKLESEGVKVLPLRKIL